MPKKPIAVEPFDLGLEIEPLAVGHPFRGGDRVSEVRRQVFRIVPLRDRSSMSDVRSA